MLYPASPNHPQHNFPVMNMDTNENPFTTTSIAFLAFTVIPDNPTASMVPVSFQVTLHASVARAAPATTTGPYTIHSGTVGRSYC